MNSSSHQAVDYFFRHEYGKVVSFLVQRFGTDYIDYIEDTVQESLIKAMQVWPYKGTPDNPTAWVLKVASNKMIDFLRRETKINQTDESEIKIDTLENELDGVTFNNELSDDLLRMMFACCTPELKAESQIILVLKILAGFGKHEIARALLKSEEATAKAYTRAKSKFKNIQPKLQVPEGLELEKRLSVVMRIIYLIFNEGYNSISKNELIKKDLCFEAMRLNKLLIDNKNLNSSKLYALMALMCFQVSRFDSRIDTNGKLLTLEEQDRKTWSRQLINKGRKYIDLAFSVSEISTYHLQASIAAMHSIAPNFAATNWQKILILYDSLLKIEPNLITSLNRIVALEKVKGSEEALKELYKLDSDKLKHNYLYYAIKGTLLGQEQNNQKANENFTIAAALTTNRAEKEYLLSKVR